MSIDLSIGDVFKQVFGVEPQAFDPEFKLVVNANDNGSDGLARKDFGNIGSSPFYGKNQVTGREYYLPVTITYADESGTASSSNSNSIGNTANGGGPVGVLKTLDLPFPIVSVSSKKTIIATPLTERRGTVKELINIQDYEFVIRGFMVNKYNEFPESLVQTLNQLNEARATVSISNVITDIFLLRPDRSGSDKVVITSFRLLDVKGIKNVRPYELTLLSDEDFSLIEIV